MSEPRALILKVGIGTNVSSVVVVSYVVVASADIVTSAVAVVSAVVVGISVVAVSVAVEAESSTLALCDSVASVEVLPSSVNVILIDNSSEVVLSAMTSVVVVERAIDPVDVDTGSVDTVPEYQLVNNVLLYKKISLTRVTRCSTSRLAHTCDCDIGAEAQGEKSSETHFRGEKGATRV